MTDLLGFDLHLEAGERPVTVVDRSFDRKIVSVASGSVSTFQRLVSSDCSELPLGDRSRAKLQPVFHRASRVGFKSARRLASASRRIQSRKFSAASLCSQRASKARTDASVESLASPRVRGARWAFPSRTARLWSN